MSEENKPDENERQAGCSDANCYAEALEIIYGVSLNNGDGKLTECRDFLKKHAPELSRKSEGERKVKPTRRGWDTDGLDYF